MQRPIRIRFGQWAPDLPALGSSKVRATGIHTMLSAAKNVVPYKGGYGPQNSLATLAGYDALAERPRGACAFTDAGGNPANYAGTETILYRLAGNGREDLTRDAGAYSCVDEKRWEFALFGDTLVAVNPNDDTQYINTRIGQKFAALRGDAADAPAGSEGAAPRAYHAAVIENHLMLGNVIDNEWGHVPNSVWWPQVGNPFHWPEPGTDEATAAISDRQPLEGDGGWVQKIIGGAEVGIIFQENAIWRADYRGGDVMFDLNRVEPDRGLLASGLAASVGRYIFYCGEDGWYVFDYTTSAPVGKERWNRYFLNDLDRDHMDRCSISPDPDSTRIYVLYPGEGNTDGQPNKYLCYDWGLDQATHGEVDAELLVSEALAKPWTLDTGDDEDNVDAAGEPSFDTRQANTGAGALGAYSSSYNLATFSGTPMEATFETGLLELDPGFWTLVSKLRPVITGNPAPACAAAALKHANTDVKYGVTGIWDDNGEVPVRANGRYHKLKLIVPTSGFDSVIGIDIPEYVRSGSR